MNRIAADSPLTRRAGFLLVVLLLAAGAVALGRLPWGTSASEVRAVPGAGLSPGGATISDGRTTPDQRDGFIDDTVSAFDDQLPAIANLKPDLRAAVQQAARDAKRDDDIDLLITSGWRTELYQRWLFDREINRAGEHAAAAAVATGDTSRHLAGDAVDVGRTDADYWLIQHGQDYGLCQVYANEIWHFELSVAPGGTCPQQYADAGSRP